MLLSGGPIKSRSIWRLQKSRRIGLNGSRNAFPLGRWEEYKEREGEEDSDANHSVESSCWHGASTDALCAKLEDEEKERMKLC